MKKIDKIKFMKFENQYEIFKWCYENPMKILFRKRSHNYHYFRWNDNKNCYEISEIKHGLDINTRNCEEFIKPSDWNELTECLANYEYRFAISIDDTKLLEDK